MKKIIALLLVLGCIFVFASCDNNGGKDNTDMGGVDISKAISDLQAALDASAPDAADITVVLESSLGNLNGSYNVVFNEDGTATVTYSYEKFNGFEGKYVPLAETVRGFAEIIDGKHDDLPESAFLYVGTIDEAVAKAKTIANA